MITKRSLLTIQSEVKEENNKEDFYSDTGPCSCVNDDNCWCFVGNSRRISRNKGLDRFFNFKEKYGFTDIKTCGNTGCITFLFEGEKYYYGPVSKKFKKKGTNKWFSWSNRNGEKKSSYKKVVRVKGKCVSCDKNIDESYVRCYNCYVTYNESKLDSSMKNTNIYS
jgi:hypothetical protein